MDLLCCRGVDPVRKSPRSWMCGFFAHGTDPPPRPYSLVFPFFPAIFVGCLPRPISVAGCPVTWLSPRFWYFSAVRLLTAHRSPFRSRLYVRLLRVPPADTVSPPH